MSHTTIVVQTLPRRLDSKRTYLNRSMTDANTNDAEANRGSRHDRSESARANNFPSQDHLSGQGDAAARDYAAGRTAAIIATARLAGATALIGNDRQWRNKPLGVVYHHVDDILALA